jgi:hypothetical protein
MMKAKGMPGFF